LFPGAAAAPSLAFGAMTFTAGDRRMKSIFKTEPAVANALVGRALDAGINFFDTADIYAFGQSEEILGAALKGRRDEVVIATKAGVRSGANLFRAGLSRRHIQWSVDHSLKRLGTDWIDVYIAHKDDVFTPLEETLAALDAVVRAGKVRYIGFSNWPAWKVAASMEIQKANNLAPFTHGQMYYSLVGRDVEYEIIPMMKRYGLGLTVWSPLASGFLSGKYNRENMADPENRLSGFDGPPFDRELGFQLVERMRAMAADHGATVSQIALAWLLAKNDVTSVILGASKLEQLEDNLGAVDLVLTPAELAELNGAIRSPEIYPHWLTKSMTDMMTAEALERKLNTATCVPEDRQGIDGVSPSP
jgi:aryl-alcohol dehydrogenase-like predicted oxidoreductase